MGSCALANALADAQKQANDALVSGAAQSKALDAAKKEAAKAE